MSLYRKAPAVVDRPAVVDTPSPKVVDRKADRHKGPRTEYMREAQRRHRAKKVGP